MPANAAPSAAVDTALRLQAVRMQIEGVQRFFDASLVLKDNASLDNYRSQLHALLDMELDLKSAMYSIIRSAGSNIHKQ